jgi:hypothetical protein
MVCLRRCRLVASNNYTGATIYTPLVTRTTILQVKRISLQYAVVSSIEPDKRADERPLSGSRFMTQSGRRNVTQERVAFGENNMDDA